MYNLPFAAEWMAQARPHLKVRVLGKYANKGVYLFAGIKSASKEIQTLDGKVILQRGERYLQPHVHGSNPLSLLQAIRAARDEIRTHRGEFVKANVKGILLQTGSEFLEKIGRKMGGIEIIVPAFERVVGMRILKGLAVLFPSRIPKPTRGWQRPKRFFIPLEKL